MNKLIYRMLLITIMATENQNTYFVGSGRFSLFTGNVCVSVGKGHQDHKIYLLLLYFWFVGRNVQYTCLVFNVNANLLTIVQCPRCVSDLDGLSIVIHMYNILFYDMKCNCLGYFIILIIIILYGYFTIYLQVQ